MIRWLLIGVGSALGYSLAKKRLSRINMVFVALSGYIAYMLTQKVMLERGELTENEVAGINGQGLFGETKCPTPGMRIRSGGAGRGYAVGRGRGPIGRRAKPVDVEVID